MSKRKRPREEFIKDLRPLKKRLTWREAMRKVFQEYPIGTDLKMKSIESDLKSIYDEGKLNTELDSGRFSSYAKGLIRKFSKETSTGGFKYSESKSLNSPNSRVVRSFLRRRKGRFFSSREIYERVKKKLKVGSKGSKTEEISTLLSELYTKKTFVNRREASSSETSRHRRRFGNKGKNPTFVYSYNNSLSDSSSGEESEESSEESEEEEEEVQEDEKNRNEFDDAIVRVLRKYGRKCGLVRCQIEDKVELESSLSPYRLTRCYEKGFISMKEFKGSVKQRFMKEFPEIRTRNTKYVYFPLSEKEEEEEEESEEESEEDDSNRLSLEDISLEEAIYRVMRRVRRGCGITSEQIRNRLTKLNNHEFTISKKNIYREKVIMTNREILQTKTVFDTLLKVLEGGSRSSISRKRISPKELESFQKKYPKSRPKFICSFVHDDDDDEDLEEDNEKVGIVSPPLQPPPPPPPLQEPLHEEFEDEDDDRNFEPQIDDSDQTNSDRAFENYMKILIEMEKRRNNLNIIKVKNNTHKNILENCCVLQKIEKNFGNGYSSKLELVEIFIPEKKVHSGPI